MRRAVQQLREEQRRTREHVGQRARVLDTDLLGLGDQLGTAAKLTAYQGADALSGVAELLNRSMATDDYLQTLVDTELEPQKQHWREGVGEVLDFFGLGIDYEAIMASANDQFHKDQQLRAAVTDANNEVSTYLRHARRLAERKLEADKRSLGRAIAATLQDQQMDAAEKTAHIRQLKEEAEKERQMTIEKAKLISASQQAGGLSLEAQQHLLETLVQRAKMAMGTVAAPTVGELEARRSDLGGAMDHTHAALSGQGLLGSLLQLSAEQDDDRARLHASMERAASGHADAPDAAPSLQSAVETRMQRSKGWMEQLDTLGDAMGAGGGTEPAGTREP